MILRYDRIAMALPPPSEPDPAGAAALQELLGRRFGEMSTFLNYTFQPFNFRGRQGARPFYDLVANIAAEEFGHVESGSAKARQAFAKKTAVPFAARKQNSRSDPPRPSEPANAVRGTSALTIPPVRGRLRPRAVRACGLRQEMDQEKAPETRPFFTSGWEPRAGAHMSGRNTERSCAGPSSAPSRALGSFDAFGRNSRRPARGVTVCVGPRTHPDS
jgi:hypothetical protein